MNFGARLTVKDNFSVTMKMAIKYQKQFKQDVNNTSKALEAQAKKKHIIQINNTAAMKSVREVAKRLEPLKKAVKTVVSVKDQATSKINAINSKVKSVAKKTIKPVVSLVDKTGNVISSIKNKLFGLKSIASGIAIGATIGKAINDGAKLEQQNIAMEHFIGVNNKGMSKTQVSNAKNDYMQQLRTNANATPFSTNEVVSAGARAINVAGGNTQQSMQLVKLAEDMASLNPEKSLSDAMEALADLKTGETERMKEFGFKISQDDIKNGGGINGIINSKLKPFFSGGAQKLSNSGAGLMSTIKGKLSTQFTDTGYKMLEKMKPTLINIIALIDKYSPKMAKLGEAIGTGFGKAIDFVGKLFGAVSSNMPAIGGIISTVSGTISNVMNWISEKFSWVGGKMGFLKEVASTVWSGISSVIQVSWGIIQPIFSMLADAVKIVVDVFQLSFPTIKSVVSSVWDFIKPLLDAMSSALKGVANAVSGVKNWVGAKVDAITGGGGGKPRAMGVTRVPYDNYPILAHEGETLLTKQESNKLSSGAKAVIEKLADTIIVREDADIDKIATALVEKLETSRANFGGVV